MKIWLDTSLSAPHARGNDCDCSDCDCLLMPGSTYTGTPIPVTKLHEHTLQLTGTIYAHECAPARWLTCDPIGSGQIAVLDEEAHSLLEQFRMPKTVAEAMATLAHTRHETSELLASAALMERLGFLQDLNEPPHFVPTPQQTLTAWLHVTNACNLGCHYCYIQKSAEHMSDDTALRSVDAIIRSATRNAYKQIRLKYSGGEASLQLEHVLRVHDYAVEQAHTQALDCLGVLLSNGVFLSSRAIDQLLERAIGVMISLDGIGEYHDQQRPFLNGRGSFKSIDRTINRLLEKGLVPHINVVVSQQSLAGLPALINYILDREMSFTLSYYRDTEHAPRPHDLQFAEGEMIAGMCALFEIIEHRMPRRRLIDSLIDKASLKAPHQFTCGVGQNYLVIDQQGGVAKCQAQMQHTVTNIDAEDPLHIIQTDQTGLRGLTVEEKEGCRSCEWRHWCTGGCPLLTFRLTGRNDIRSPNCNIYKALFPEALRLEALRLLTYETPVMF